MVFFQLNAPTRCWLPWIIEVRQVVLPLTHRWNSGRVYGLWECQIRRNTSPDMLVIMPSLQWLTFSTDTSAPLTSVSSAIPIPKTPFMHYRRAASWKQSGTLCLGLFLLPRPAHRPLTLYWIVFCRWGTISGRRSSSWRHGQYGIKEMLWNLGIQQYR